MTHSARTRRRLSDGRTTWPDSLARAIRSAKELRHRLRLPEDPDPAVIPHDFPVLVPESYVDRMIPGDLQDPLLRQVLSTAEEQIPIPGFSTDAVEDQQARIAPGLLQKYHGRALMVLTGACAIHCRYCFRRHYPYQDDPRRLDDWEPAFAALEADVTLREVLLSGGDPLMIPDKRLAEFVQRLARIPHLRRIRVHSRLPIVLPDRVTADLIDLFRGTRLTPIFVVHANHARELVGDCADALRRLVRAGIMTLNQTVLLRGVNDSVDALYELSERLIELGVLPYYLHQLDRVSGAAHFEVDEVRGREIVADLQARLPGYAVPRYVREIAGAASKTPIGVSIPE